MLHRVRLAMGDPHDVKLGGPDGGTVEVDETFIGGKARNMHKDKRARLAMNLYSAQLYGGKGKAIVIGMLERGGKVKARVIRETLERADAGIRPRSCEKGTTVMTDEARQYLGIADEYVHEVINHMEGYVRGHVSTNGIENFWSLLKRGLSGTYVSVEPFHLFRYLDEQMFRFNNRATRDNPLNDSDRFALALSQIVGKRLTYSELTGKEGQTGAF